MKFIIIPVIVIIVCQLIKLSILFFKERKKLSLKQIIWEGFWVGKFPSSHSAVLASSFYLITKYSNNASVTSFSFFVCLMFLYGLLEDKKRNEIMEMYFIKSNDIELKQIVLDRKLKEFNGHGYIELIVGIVLGVILTSVLDKLFL